VHIWIKVKDALVAEGLENVISDTRELGIAQEFTEAGKTR
jgi:hypothetical protein